MNSKALNRAKTGFRARLGRDLRPPVERIGRYVDDDELLLIIFLRILTRYLGISCRTCTYQSTVELVGKYRVRSLTNRYLVDILVFYALIQKSCVVFLTGSASAVNLIEMAFLKTLNSWTGLTCARAPEIPHLALVLDYVLVTF